MSWGEMSLCLKQGTIVILPVPDSSGQMSSGSGFDYNTEKNGNLNYKGKEYAGDTSFILMVRIIFAI